MHTLKQNSQFFVFSKQHDDDFLAWLMTIFTGDFYPMVVISYLWYIFNIVIIFKLFAWIAEKAIFIRKYNFPLYFHVKMDIITTWYQVARNARLKLSFEILYFLDVSSHSETSDTKIKSSSGMCAYVSQSLRFFRNGYTDFKILPSIW